MADIILKCDKILNEDSSVKQYDFSYEVEDNGRINNFCVRVLASEMTDPTSATEAKTKANVKAKAIKDAWLDMPVVSASAVNSVVGNVTL